VRGSRLVVILLAMLALAGALLACDAIPGPQPTPTVAGTPAPPTDTPVPTATAAPTNTPVPTPTEGAVRTPVGGPAGPEFMAALAAMDVAPTYSYTLRMQLGPTSTEYLLTGSGRHQPPADYDTNYSALGYHTEIAVISGTTYFRNFGVWQKGLPDAAAFPQGPPPDIPAILGLLTYAADAGLAPEGSDGSDASSGRHLQFRLEPDGLVGPGGPGLGASGGDLWVDPETHRYVRLILNFGRPGAPADNAGQLQMDFLDYGAPVTLTPPPVPSPSSN
jgi:hypothetical protein